MELSYTLRLPPDVASVPLVRGLIHTSMQQLGVSPQCIADVGLAVTEACANVVTHGRGAGHEYEVQVVLDPVECHIRVIDTGKGFDPDAVRAGGDFAEGGRGVVLMRALMDRLDFLPAGEGEQRGTMVHLAKRLDLVPGSPLEIMGSPKP